MTQNERLLQCLRDGVTVNPMVAWRELGIYRLSARINDLRNDGHRIEKDMTLVSNRFGETCKVAYYRLVRP